ncbi:MAG TPA: hypothetical protein VIT68_04025 [Candidatus Gracilibacteria bacterium]
MKKLLALSFLATKLLGLYCFGSMSLAAWGAVEAKAPCHGVEVLQIAENQETDCEACAIAAESWDQEILAAGDIVFTQFAALPVLVWEAIIQPSPLVAGIYQSYDPPPQVIYKTAFHLPTSVTVILS